MKERKRKVEPSSFIGVDEIKRDWEATTTRWKLDIDLYQEIADTINKADLDEIEPHSFALEFADMHRNAERLTGQIDRLLAPFEIGNKAWGLDDPNQPGTPPTALFSVKDMRFGADDYDRLETFQNGLKIAMPLLKRLSFLADTRNPATSLQVTSWAIVCRALQEMKRRQEIPNKRAWPVGTTEWSPAVQIASKIAKRLGYGATPKSVAAALKRAGVADRTPPSEILGNPRPR